MPDITNFTKYHLGCGGIFIKGFLNIDFDHDLPRDTIYADHKGIDGAYFFNYDLRNGLPGENSALELIYHCHFFEHLAFPEALELLRQSHLRLKPDGKMRIVVPDLELWIQNYHNNNIAFFDSYRRQILGNDFGLFKTKAAVFMGMLHMHGHRWGYDYETLEWLLQRAGFGNVRRFLFQESSIPEIRAMEPYSPLRGMESLCVECTKITAKGGSAAATARDIGPIEDRKALFAGSFGFEVGPIYSTVKDMPGRRALVQGWSRGEETHTWSDGERATLILPLSRDKAESGGLILRLNGWVISGPWAARIFVDGALATTITKSANDPREVRFAVSLPEGVLANDNPIVQVDCVFENTDCPRENRRSGDGRHLSFALQSFKFDSDPYDAAKSDLAPLHRVLERCSPRLTVSAVGDDLQAVEKMSALLKAAGLCGLLVLVSSSPPAGQLPVFDPSSAADKKALRADLATQLKVRTYQGSLAPLLATLSEQRAGPDLIVLANSDQFPEAVEALSQSAPAAGTAPPDITVLTYDEGFWGPAYWHNPTFFSKVVSPLTAVSWPHFVHLFSQNPSVARRPHGTMVANFDENGLSFLVEGYSTPNARTGPTISLFRSLLGDACRSSSQTQSMLVVQYDDFAHDDVLSVAYGRRRGWNPAVRLIPDTFFFSNLGYEPIRAAFSEGKLPSWEDRKSVVFWRGSATTNYVACAGTPVERIEQVPRIAMCLALRDFPQTDAAVMHAWLLHLHLGVPQADVVAFLTAEKIYQPLLPIIQHAAYRFLIDIDGVGNAWSFFEKLLLGSCILKVQSPFEQWFYGEITEWQHYVPVKQDLSDMAEKIEWCQQHQAEARTIAERGQQFAMQHTYSTGREIALDAIRLSTISGRPGFHP